MKLYELNRGEWFKLKEDPQIAPESLSPFLDLKYMLSNIDGMYSSIRDREGNVYHFAAWTEVEQCETISD